DDSLREPGAVLEQNLPGLDVDDLHEQEVLNTALAGLTLVGVVHPAGHEVARADLLPPFGDRARVEGPRVLPLDLLHELRLLLHADDAHVTRVHEPRLHLAQQGIEGAVDVLAGFVAHRDHGHRRAALSLPPLHHGRALQRLHVFVQHLLQVAPVEARAHRLVIETRDVFTTNGPRAAARGEGHGNSKHPSYRETGTRHSFCLSERGHAAEPFRCGVPPLESSWPPRSETTLRSETLRWPAAGRGERAGLAGPDRRLRDIGYRPLDGPGAPIMHSPEPSAQSSLISDNYFCRSTTIRIADAGAC